MSKRVTRSRSRNAIKIAAMAVLAGTAAGCSSDVTRFSAPVFTGSTDNQDKIINPGEARPTYDEIVTGSIPPSGSASGEAVERRPLGSPPKRSTAYTPTGRGDRVVDTPGRWTAIGGTAVTLGPGENLSTVSRRYGVPLHALQRANKARSSTVFGAGDRVIIPVYVAGGKRIVARPKTPAATSKPVLVASAKPVAIAAPVEKRPKAVRSKSGYHVIKPGETLYSIARKYEVTRAEIIRENEITDANVLRSGQKLRIPGAKVKVASLPRKSRPKPSAKKKRTSKKKVASAKPIMIKTDADRRRSRKPASELVSVPSAVTAAARVDDGTVTTGSIPTKPVTEARTLFRWPVRGRIIARFGRRSNGQHNDGINLAVPEGTSVKAADNGTVIYAGNELKGYGNLLLVAHQDGWVSAYAHNSELMVSRGDTVRRGQIIARAGSTGNVDRPQLHFELRRNSSPVDPTPYMSGA